MSIIFLKKSNFFSFQSREEELRQALRCMDIGKSTSQALDRGAVDDALGSALEQRESVEGKLTSLEKYTARLELVSQWLSDAKNKLSSSNYSPEPILAEVADREAEIKEVLGNFTNLEKECNVAEQTVSPQLQVCVCILWNLRNERK